LPKLTNIKIEGIKKLPQKPVVKVYVEVDFLTSQARAGFFQDLGTCFSKGVTFYVTCSLNNVSCVQCALHFRHHRFLGHRQDIGFSSVFRLSSLLTA